MSLRTTPLLVGLSYAIFAWGMYARHIAPSACAQVLTPTCVQAVLAAG